MFLCAKNIPSSHMLIHESRSKGYHTVVTAIFIICGACVIRHDSDCMKISSHFKTAYLKLVANYVLQNARSPLLSASHCA